MIPSMPMVSFIATILIVVAASVTSAGDDFRKRRVNA